MPREIVRERAVPRPVRDSTRCSTATKNAGIDGYASCPHQEIQRRCRSPMTEAADKEVLGGSTIKGPAWGESACSPARALIFEVRFCSLPDFPVESCHVLGELLWLRDDHNAIRLAQNEQFIAGGKPQGFASFSRDDDLIFATEGDGRCHEVLECGQNTPSRRTCWIGSSRPRGPISAEQQTSRISGRRRGGCISRWCWICSLVALSVGS